MSSGAARRFYEQSRQRRSAVGGSAPPPATVIPPGTRYAAAYRFLGENPGKVVCELGYGGPALLNALAPRCSSLDVIDIIDRNDGAPPPTNVTLSVGDLDDDFPYSSERFDVVLAMMVLEHLYDPFHSFRELARILKPGGIAFVNLPNIASIRCRLALLFGHMPMTSSRDWFEKREWDGNHLHYFTISDVRRIADLNGLRLIQITPVGKLYRLKTLFPALLCHEITYAFEKIA